MKFFTARLWVLALLVFGNSSIAYGDEPRVYFEKECLALFSAHSAGAMSENETKVDEGRGMLRFEKTVVTETRDGVAETYIQIRNCKSLETAAGRL